MKYIIMGFAHCGTCSLEKYLVDRGHDVIRREDGFRTMTVQYFKDKYPDRRPLFIISEKKKHMYDFDAILKQWHTIRPVVIKLENIAKNEDFPWENKNDCYSKKGIRPVYS